MKMKYAIIPSRACNDRDLTFGAFRTLACMCLYTSSNGICFPNQQTLADLRGVSRQVITKHIRQLRILNYIIDLEPKGKKYPRAFKRGNRYFIPTREGDQPPSKEVIRDDILSEARRPPNIC